MDFYHKVWSFQRHNNNVVTKERRFILNYQTKDWYYNLPSLELMKTFASNTCYLGNGWKNYSAWMLHGCVFSFYPY